MEASMSKKKDKSVSRRDFVKGTLGAGSALALGACASPNTTPVEWDKEADVVVVGYGGAGAAAAITVAEAGGSVIILEKAPEPGGNTAVSSGGMRLASDAAKMAEFLEATGLGTIDKQMATEFANVWAGLEDWFRSHGARITVTERSHRFIGVFPGAEALNRGISMDRDDEWTGVGRDLFEFLQNTTERNEEVEVLLETPAERLVREPSTGRILGVTARRGDEQLNIKAAKAVIMALGGFEANREMMATYIEEAPVPIAVGGTPYNTGDGIQMVLDVGADLWHMNGVEWSRQGFKPPELPAAWWLGPKTDAWINVNKAGIRFRDESVTYGHAKKHLEVFHFDKPRSVWPNHPWYMVFDEKTRAAGPIIMVYRSAGRAPFVTYNMARELHTWSQDNLQEIEKGWIVRGNNLAELAEKVEIDPSGLAETVAKYNRSCRRGVDEEFGRDSKRLTPIDKPPFYAIECCVNLINTQGGPRRNAKSQVLDPYGRPIPSLYGVGEFGSIYGFLYPGGCNLPECIVSGILAGRSAVEEERA
jgi:succinate dehydrogenase/fumarate reductase flavoprotein subunit